MRTFVPFLFTVAAFLWATQVAASEQPATSWVVITTDQPDAEAFLDARRVGLTPIRVEGVQVGEHVARVRAAGRTGVRSFQLGERGRTIHVPLTDREHPLAIALNAAMGFRGQAALFSGGFALLYHTFHHEGGLVVDGFDIRGVQDLIMQGVIARLEYGYAPWSIHGGRNTWVQPLKLRARVNMARTTSLSLVEGEERIERRPVAGLGGGVVLGSEMQVGRFGLEPSVYYDIFGLRTVTVGETDLRPPLDNGGFNLRFKFYL